MPGSRYYYHLYVTDKQRGIQYRKEGSYSCYVAKTRLLQFLMPLTQMHCLLGLHVCCHLTGITALCGYTMNGHLSPSDNKLAALSDSTISDYNLWHVHLQQVQVSQTERNQGIVTFLGFFFGTHFTKSTMVEPIVLVIIKLRLNFFLLTKCAVNDENMMQFT